MPDRDQNSFLGGSREFYPCGNGIGIGSEKTGRAWSRLKKKSCKSAPGILFLALTLPTLASQSVELVWNSSKSPNIIGYHVYYGGAGNGYTNEIFVGNLTNLTVPGLAEGATYYFAIKAVNSAGIESGYSSPTSYSVPTTAAIWKMPAVSSSGVSMPVTGLPGHLYVIQASTNLVNWTSLETNLTPLVFTDKNASQYKRRFYRAVYLY